MSENPDWVTASPRHSTVPLGIDTSVPHCARVWDYWLGGKDNFAADREVGKRILAATPQLAVMAQADRQFLGRVVRHLAADVGVRQFLDIGTGIPTADNTHEVAQAVAPECRIVYVDNDPIVLGHARALLSSTAEGATDYLEADARDTEKIVAAAGSTLDFGRPIAVMLLGILEFIPDDGEAYSIVHRLMDAVPSGSYLAIAHSTNEVQRDEMDEAARRWNDSGATPIVLRDRAELTRFFDGLEVLEPAVGSCSLWRPDPDTSYTDEVVAQFGAVARKP